MAVKPKGKPKGAERDFPASEAFAEAMDQIAEGADPFARPTTVYEASLPPISSEVVRVRGGPKVRIAKTHGRVDKEATNATLANLKKLIGFEPPEE